MVVDLTAETTPQVLVTLTPILPPKNPEPNVTLMLLVEDVPVHPGGNVHVYVAAPLTGATLYARVCPGQAIVFPRSCVMVAAEVDNAKHFTALVKHDVCAATHTVPLVKLDAKFTDAEVPLPITEALPLTVHRYDVAPVTALVLYI